MRLRKLAAAVATVMMASSPAMAGDPSDHRDPRRTVRAGDFPGTVTSAHEDPRQSNRLVSGAPDDPAPAVLALFSSGSSAASTAVVANVAALAAADFSAYRAIVLQGYHFANDGGGGVLLNSGAGAGDHCTAFNDSTGAVFLRMDFKTEISTRGCGAYGDDAHDDWQALTYWWVAVENSSTASAHIDGGVYRFTRPLVWDYSNRRKTGVRMWGDGFFTSVLNCAMASDVCVQLQVTTGADAYYNSWEDFRVQGRSTDVILAHGRLGGTDTFQSSFFKSFSVINNQCANSSSVAWDINGLLTGSGVNVQAGNCPATATFAGSGDAIRATAMANMMFDGLTLNGRIGIHVTEVGTPVFPVYGNIIHPDIENAFYGVRQDVSTAYNNRLQGGAAYAIHPAGYLISVTGTRSPGWPGSSWRIEDVTVNYNQLYGTPSVAPAMDPDHHVGVLFVGGGYGTVATPPFPASGAPYTNNTGQVQNVTWWGSGSIVKLVMNGLNVGVTVNQATLAPGDHIEFFYTGSLSWYFRNAVN